MKVNVEKDVIVQDIICQFVVLMVRLILMNVLWIVKERNWTIMVNVNKREKKTVQNTMIQYVDMMVELMITSVLHNNTISKLNISVSVE